MRSEEESTSSNLEEAAGEIMRLQNGSDVRGIAMEGEEGREVNLTPAAVYCIAEAFGEWVGKSLGKPATKVRVSLGRDPRLTGPSLTNAAAGGLRNAACSVYDMGLATTPACFMSTVLPGFNYDASIMDFLDGVVVITTSTAISHQGIRINANGSVNLQLSSGTVGVIESLYSSIKPVHVMNKTIELRPAGKLTSGETKYLITADVVRGYLHRILSSTLEFIIESGKGKLFKTPVPPESVSFYITQDTQRHQLLPALRSGGFRVTGRLATQCSLTDPVMGEVIVEASAVPICSIDIQLLRVESIIVGERTAVETSVIQTTQVADGDVCRCMSLPIYFILPRLLTCPNLSAG